MIVHRWKTLRRSAYWSHRHNDVDYYFADAVRVSRFRKFRRDLRNEVLAWEGIFPHRGGYLPCTGTLDTLAGEVCLLPEDREEELEVLSDLRAMLEEAAMLFEEGLFDERWA